jgi:hypothetical protein
MSGIRALGVFHVLIGVLLLPLVVLFGLVLAPVLLIGPIWGIVLGARMWRPTPDVLAAVRRTHWAYLVVDALLVAYGIFALRAAERSAAHGGGLLGGVGLIPLALGIGMAVFSVITLAMARAPRALVVCALALAICSANPKATAPQDTAVQNGIVQQWSVRVARPLALEAPIKGFITNPAELARLWQAWQIKGDVPSVDFSKYFILVATARSSVFKVRAIQVDEKGDLKTVVIATPDITRDYAIVITQVERAGVKTVHGQAVE